MESRKVTLVVLLLISLRDITGVMVSQKESSESLSPSVVPSVVTPVVPSVVTPVVPSVVTPVVPSVVAPVVPTVVTQ